MLAATLLVHLPNGFFAPNGYELVLLLLGSSIALAVIGPGALALDNIITRPVPRAVPVGEPRSR